MENVAPQVYIDLLRSEVVPALGCTEPIAVALAVARAREALQSSPCRVSVGTSANIFKNGMGVGIPGTGQTGLIIAAALGAVEGNSQDSLELLKHVNNESVRRAEALIARAGPAGDGSQALVVRSIGEDVTADDLEAMTGAPVVVTIPNDRAVTQRVARGDDPTRGRGSTRRAARAVASGLLEADRPW